MMLCGLVPPGESLLLTDTVLLSYTWLPTLSLFALAASVFPLAGAFGSAQQTACILFHSNSALCQQKPLYNVI